MTQVHGQQGRSGRVPQTLRPPWTDETRIRDNCTSCGACIKTCPESILVTARAGTPAIELNGGACTFCGDCAAACDEPVFRSTDETPWTIIAAIGSSCLLHQGVTCQSCTDACDVAALSFSFASGPAGAISLDSDLCTGCGACLGVCPVSAIQLTFPQLTCAA